MGFMPLVPLQWVFVKMMLRTYNTLETIHDGPCASVIRPHLHNCWTTDPDSNRPDCLVLWVQLETNVRINHFRYFCLFVPSLMQTHFCNCCLKENSRKSFKSILNISLSSKRLYVKTHSMQLYTDIYLYLNSSLGHGILWTDNRTRFKVFYLSKNLQFSLEWGSIVFCRIGTLCLRVTPMFSDGLPIFTDMASFTLKLLFFSGKYSQLHCLKSFLYWKGMYKKVKTKPDEKCFGCPRG